MKENKLIFKIEASEEKMKLREYLRAVQKLSGRLIKGAALAGRITVNGNRAKLNYVLKTNDEVAFDLIKEESQNIEPEKMDVDVIYEDSDIIVVNKRPGMVVHPTKSYQSGTLANGLIYYFREKGENCIVRLVSRLDMDTSGLIIIAKNQFSHMALARDMVKDTFEKSYLAVVHGNMSETKGTINLPIYRPSDDSIKRAVDERGQDSVTHFEVMERFKNSDLVKLTLETGRTHQIRVHLTHLGHPLYGDVLYGIEDDKEYISRQALHAYRLKFPHPRTGKDIELEVGLPKDIIELIQKINES
ncbi:RluA family pseudouridine synthase [Clostridium magnum]|uniref:Pseudouridine synthase n=1 Tax=Clostridium magnum DSM 2767 TaxID=1121326 RepID=A0A162UG35_9CLOT|nr:RluA family pseudouridine synthase [Clostridium magnum]KZL93863.1 ribosomal large subunit pseudouridine synthase D [Clostridium magnum DSM 2767]SHH97420.1 23S rRNA pseudouridine1911/1915/1917 synthase [Clostridium magnum DSM 2767]